MLTVCMLLAADSSGGIVVVWSEVNDKDIMDLKMQRFRDGKPGAWVIFDSSRGNEFNISAARVGLDGRGTTAMRGRTTARPTGSTGATSIATPTTRSTMPTNGG